MCNTVWEAKMPGIVKQVCKGRVVIRNDHYGRTLEGINKLYEAAKADFPTLNPRDVEVVVYGGDRISGYMGIEFEMPMQNVPEAYERISYLELTR